MFHFLVPCQCGQKLEVTAAQAGQRLTCACGRTVDVPTLRGLQSLERTGSAAASATRRWGARQGLLFLGGAIAGAALLAALWLQITRPSGVIITERLVTSPSQPGQDVLDLTEPRSNFDSLTPADVWLTWQITTPAGVDWRPTRSGAFAEQNEASRALSWRDWRFMVWVIAGIGVVIIAVGLLIPAKGTKRRSPRKKAGATT